jgi:hypothetical protein
MKKLFAFLLLIILFAGCDSKENETKITEDDKNKYNFDTSALKTQPVDNPNESVLLNYNFDKDRVYKYRLTTLSNVRQEVEADTTIVQEIDQSIIYLLELKLINKEDENISELSCNISSVKVDMEGNNQKISYEYGTVKDSAEREKYAEYESLVNNPFNARITKAGEITEVYKSDKIINKYLTMRGLIDSLSAQEKTLVRNDIVEGLLKPILTQVIRKMPDKNIAKDSSWSTEQPATKLMIFDVKSTNTYKMGGLEMLDDDKIAVIDAGLKTNISGTNKFTDRGMSYDFRTPVTKGTGKIYFNITDGIIVKSRTKTTVDIFFTMEANLPQGKQRGSRKETINNTNILELL